MDSSDSLKIDENLARLLAAYDQSIDGGDDGAVTLNVPAPEEFHVSSPLERPVTPLSGASNEGSLGEVLPDSARMRPPLGGYSPNGGAAGPHRVGRFELRRQLGKGGCGIVFLAYDPKLQREVALKIPRPEMLLNTDAKRRLQREALAAAEFDHPNLVPVYDFGEVGPLCYIASAFCPGQTLAEWHDRQAFPVPVRQAARLVATVAEAVQHAHDRGVLHRDLKPNNVILQEMKLEENDEPPLGGVQLRGEFYVPRLVDFGLAKLLERGGPSETGTRQILGTPKYMSPEQAQARREDIGPTADVYALGVILYELLAGRAPYEGASDIEVLRQAIEGKPEAPRKLRPDVPRDLEAICLKAMARTPADRYRTAIDLADDLRRFLDERPTVARPLAWPGRAARWLRRNDQIVAIGVLATIVLSVTAVSTVNWRLSQQLQKKYDSVVGQQDSRNRAEQEREYSRQVRDAAFAWRNGNRTAALAALDAAQSLALVRMESPEFTHAYLRRQLVSPRLVIACPAGAVTALAVSPDGARLASGHADGTAVVWDRATGNQLGTVKAHESEVTHLAFALGGSLILTAGATPDSASTVLGWSAARSGSLAPAPGQHRLLARDAYCFVVAPDGRTLYTGGRAGSLTKVDLKDLKAGAARPAEPGAPAVVAVAVSRDGGRVLAADRAGRVRVWTAELAPDPAGDYEFGGPLSALAVGEGGRPAAGFGNGRFALARPGIAPTLGAAGGRVHWVATAPGGRFALPSGPGRVMLGWSWELPTGDLGEVRAGVFSPDGKTLFTGSDDGAIRAWLLPADTREQAAARVGRVAAVAASPDGGAVVAAEGGGITRLGVDGVVRRLEVRPRPFATVKVLEDGTVRGVALDGRSVIATDVVGNTGAERFRARSPNRRTATSTALNADGTRLAVGDDGGRITVSSLTATEVHGIDTGSPQPVRKVTVSKDGRYVCAPTPTGLGIWLVGTAELLGTVEADEQTVFCFLPSSDRLLTGGRDGVVRVWTLAGREDSSLSGHVGRVTAVGASPDGRTLVSGGTNGEVKFWDVRTGQELLGLRRHSVAVTEIEFAPGGRVLVTAGAGQFAVWDARE